MMKAETFRKVLRENNVEATPGEMIRILDLVAGFCDAYAAEVKAEHENATFTISEYYETAFSVRRLKSEFFELD